MEAGGCYLNQKSTFLCWTIFLSDICVCVLSEGSTSRIVSLSQQTECPNVRFLLISLAQYLREKLMGYLKTQMNSEILCTVKLTEFGRHSMKIYP